MTYRLAQGYFPSVMNRWQHTRAFVVQFHPETDMAAEICRGRVEHIATSRGTRFDSWTGLIGFFEAALAHAQAGAAFGVELPESNRTNETTKRGE